MCVRQTHNIVFEFSFYTELPSPFLPLSNSLCSYLCSNSISFLFHLLVPLIQLPVPPCSWSYLCLTVFTAMGPSLLISYQTPSAACFTYLCLSIYLSYPTLLLVSPATCLSNSLLQLPVPLCDQNLCLSMLKLLVPFYASATCPSLCFSYLSLSML
jgi:hypothetical protein